MHVKSFPGFHPISFQTTKISSHPQLKYLPFHPFIFHPIDRKDDMDRMHPLSQTTVHSTIKKIIPNTIFYQYF